MFKRNELTLIDLHMYRHMFLNWTTVLQLMNHSVDAFAATIMLPIVMIELLHEVIVIWHDTVEYDELYQVLK